MNIIYSRKDLMNMSDQLYQKERKSDLITCSRSLISLKKEMENILDEHLVKITKDIQKLKEVNETKRVYNSDLQYFDWGGYEYTPHKEYDFLESKLKESVDRYDELIDLIVENNNELNEYLKSIKSDKL